MTLRQRIPDYFDRRGMVEHTVEGETLNDLLQAEWVQRWTKYPEFYRLSIARHGRGDSPLLMAEMMHGRMWWVIGYLSGYDGNDLPEWQPPTHDAANAAT